MNNFVVTTTVQMAEPFTKTQEFYCPFGADAAFWKAVDSSKVLEEWGYPMSVTLTSKLQLSNPSDWDWDVESPCGCDACREAEAYDELPQLSAGLSHSNSCC